MRTAICISGLARCYKKTWPLFEKNVLGPLRARGPVDIFISIWDTADLRALSPRSMVEEPKVDIDEVMGLYHPVALDVESFGDLRDSFQITRFVSEGSYDRSVVKDGLLTAAPAQYKVLRCNEMKRAYERVKGFGYDMVVRIRFDVEVTHLRVDDMDLAKVNVLYDDGGLVGDYLYVANSENMDKVAALYRDYPRLLSVPNTDMGPERNLKNYLVHSGLETSILRGYNFALVRETFRQEYRWVERENAYRPYTPILICSALYYSGSLARGDDMVRENRFYPGKCSETFLVWYQYLRKHYPEDHIVLLADSASPIPVQPLLDTLPEPYDTFTGSVVTPAPWSDGPKVHVKWLSDFAGQYFWPMQRNLVEALKIGYCSNQNIFWLDADAFLNSDIRPVVRDGDVLASNVAHHQMTMDSVCFYVSSKRLHALDELSMDLPAYLDNVLKRAPFNTRMHSLHEGGLYKTFWYGDAREMTHINLAHLSCYSRFMTFLRANSLETPEYRALVEALETFDFSRIPNAELTFLDMLHSETSGRIP